MTDIRSLVLRVECTEGCASSLFWTRRKAITLIVLVLALITPPPSYGEKNRGREASVVNDLDRISDYEGRTEIDGVTVIAAVAPLWGSGRTTMYVSLINNTDSTFWLALTNDRPLRDSDQQLKYWYGYESLQDSGKIVEDGCVYDVKTGTILVKAGVLCSASIPSAQSYQKWETEILALTIGNSKIVLSPVTIKERIQRERQKKYRTQRYYELLPKSELQ